MPRCPDAALHLRRFVLLTASLLCASCGVWAEDAIAWSFDRPSEVIAAQNINHVRVTNGQFAGFAGWDPQVLLRCPENGIDAARLNWLTVRLYSSDAADRLDVYYASPEGNWCLGGKLPVCKGWATYRLDLNNNAWRETEAGAASKRWGGPSKRVSALRLDPGNQAGRWIMVDRVCLGPIGPGFEEGVTAEPRGTARLKALRVPKAVAACGVLDVSADLEVSVPEGLAEGTVFLRLWQGAVPLSAQEQRVAFSNAAVTVSATFPVSRYWNSGTLAVETGSYELEVTEGGVPAKAETGFTNGFIGKVQPPVCELRRVGGDAALFVNGKPLPGYLYSAEGAPRLDFHRALAQAGVRLYSGWFGLSHCGDMGHVAPDRYDYSEYDRYFASILETDPDAWFLPHIGLAGPLWWQQAHPEEMSLNEDGTRNPTSFASEAWKRDMGEDLRRLLAHLRRSPYADRIIGFILFSGATCEWQMWGTWKPSRDDYSAPALRAFRAFLATRYGSDARLRTAWADGAVTLATAEMPRGTIRHPSGPQVFRDPATERQAMDFYAFISGMTADAILHFARIAREATEGRALVGTYYAYLTAHGVNQQDSGHLAAQRVFDSPDIDFLMSPPNYAYRSPGETSLFMSAADSFRMRGKLWLDESDHRTFLSEPDSGFGRASTLEETLGVFRREFAEVLSKRAAVSWLDMKGDWFEHPALLSEMGRQAAVMRESLSRRKPFAPEVGVFVDPESFYRMRSTEANAALVLRQAVTLPQAGVPWDFCLLSDLADARLPDYKLYLFLNAFQVDAARREVIRRKLKRNNATALFVYAPGYFGADGASLANIRALTGIRIAKDESEGKPQILLDPKTPLAQGLSSDEPVGAKELTVAPLFYADDPSAHVVGRLVGSQRAGLVVKRMDGWTSIYSAAMTLPPALVRNIARQAGAHIWLETGDALYTDGSFLGVHASAGGTKRVRLPFACGVTDAMSGTPLTAQGQTVPLEMRRAETVLLRLER